MRRALARSEGIFTGITGGATLAGALRIAGKSRRGSRILALLPDTGERYQSTPLFADIAVEMSDEELRHIPFHATARFDAAVQAPAAGGGDSTGSAPRTPKPAEVVARAISDPEVPVVMFALEWCEFCWSLRRLFAHLASPSAASTWIARQCCRK